MCRCLDCSMILYQKMKEYDIRYRNPIGLEKYLLKKIINCFGNEIVNNAIIALEL